MRLPWALMLLLFAPQLARAEFEHGLYSVNYSRESLAPIINVFRFNKMDFSVELEGRTYFATLIVSNPYRIVTDTQSGLQEQRKIQAAVNEAHSWFYDQIALEHPEINPDKFKELKLKRRKYYAHSVRVLIREGSNEGPLVGHFRAVLEDRKGLPVEREMKRRLPNPPDLKVEDGETKVYGSIIQIMELLSKTKHIAGLMHYLISEIGISYLQDQARVYDFPAWRTFGIPRRFRNAAVLPVEVILVTGNQDRNMMGYYERLNMKKYKKIAGGDWILRGSIQDFIDWRVLNYFFRRSQAELRNRHIKYFYISEGGKVEFLNYEVSKAGILHLKADPPYRGDSINRPPSIYFGLNLQYPPGTSRSCKDL